MKKLLLAGACALLSACAAVHTEDYAGKTPVYDIRHYLNGNLEAKGAFIGRDNLANPFMQVKMKGTWHGDDGTLEEWFTYSEETTSPSHRVWHLHFTDEHHFTGTAADVVGVAQGEQYGNAANMQYTLDVKGHHMTMNDWMYMIDAHTVINRTTMSKLGVQFGEIVLSFSKK